MSEYLLSQNGDDQNDTLQVLRETKYFSDVLFIISVDTSPTSQFPSSGDEVAEQAALST